MRKMRIFKTKQPSNGAHQAYSTFKVVRSNECKPILGKNDINNTNNSNETIYFTHFSPYKTSANFLSGQSYFTHVNDFAHVQQFSLATAL